MTKRGGAKGWHPEDIKAALRKRYGPLTHLSVRWGFHRTSITSAIKRPNFSVALERRIAEALGVSPHTLWPDRWTPQGESRPRSVIAAHASRPSRTSHRQKR